MASFANDICQVTDSIEIAMLEKLHSIFKVETDSLIYFAIDFHQVRANYAFGDNAHNTSCVYFTAEVSLFVEIKNGLQFATTESCHVRNLVQPAAADVVGKGNDG